ncbi:uncharacterized protein BT62DRAFT_921853 [Guyanagaster necrorhizus]|uniref:Uncharacterized protein n=1 Tax=Guyanagaster necrorhizus TaxID=856835 RepID=A0A9P7VM26_9AGAR|nr:uncharacterized protein BT62DRAFT_921853 [Guyanagaster necrorhizus MCA 3950]KAG7443698.1 hypothetical protein BT62DRAFT_921853 [Guyanagaster necrorhizus MCA 3950]
MPLESTAYESGSEAAGVLGFQNGVLGELMRVLSMVERYYPKSVLPSCLVLNLHLLLDILSKGISVSNFILWGEDQVNRSTAAAAAAAAACQYLSLLLSLAKNMSSVLTIPVLPLLLLESMAIIWEEVEVGIGAAFLLQDIVKCLIAQTVIDWHP